PGAEFLDALQVLRVLWEARGASEAVSERRLHDALRLPIDRLEAILETLRAVRWVSRSAHGWELSRDTAAISAADVYRLFVFRPGDQLPPRQSGERLDQLALSLAGSTGESLQLSLADLFQPTRPAAPTPDT